MIVPIPKDVPLELHQEFLKNYTILTKGTGKLFLFSADHKIEHLDNDFTGPQIPPEVHNPQHLFEIAKHAPIGAMATQLGLIARYGSYYPTIPYVIKLNSKSSLIPLEEKDPFSRVLWSVQDVIHFRRSSQLIIPAIGITVYLGSLYEDIMLEQAAQAVFQAHQMGLIAIIWMYPRGKNISDETDPKLLAGAVGVAACLGADFVKIHTPKYSQQATRSDLLKNIVEAAGTTKVITAGGSLRDHEELITILKEDITLAGISGAAIGRSIFQHTLKEALGVCHALAQCIYR
jgi:DhnA family fructose-bisphosphate aldolase class Ia